jgi:hypothetical protein
MATDIKFIKKNELSKKQNFNRKSIYFRSFENLRQIQQLHENNE